MAVFTAFSDESGAAGTESIYLVGGYIAAENLWDHYANAWHDVVLAAPPPIPCVHMKEIRGPAFQQKHQIGPKQAAEKVATATTLLQNIAASSHPGRPAMHAVLSVIKRSDLWDMNMWIESQGHTIAKGSMDMPDYLCFMAYAQIALAATSLLFPDLTKIDFVVSQNGKVTKHFAEYLDGIKKRLENSSIVGDLIPGDPSTTNPLQMADVLCWHTRKYYEFGVVDDDMIRLRQTRTFIHEWKSDKFEEFTKNLINRLDAAD